MIKPAIGLIGVAGVMIVVGHQVGVGVPVVVVMGAAGVDLDEADAALDQPPGDQAFAAEIGGARLVDAVERAGLGRFLAQIDGLGRGLLHAKGQLVAGDSRGQLRVVGTRGEVASFFSRRRSSSSRRVARSVPGGEARSWIGTESARRTVAWNAAGM